MSALTKNEREGLEDVFLSIHSNKNKYEKLKKISSLIIANETTINCISLLKQAKVGIKEVKISDYLLSFNKKKKNLSK